MNLPTKIYRYIKRTPFSAMFRDSFFMFFPEISWKINKKYLRGKIERCKRKNMPFIFELKYGGLGDHLVFSALPEFFTKKLGIKFQISSRSPFFQEEIKEIVWSNNPYVEFTDRPGVKMGCPIVEKFKNYNDAYADIFGMEKGERTIKLYYQPKKMMAGEDEIVCDLTFGPSGEHNGYTEKIFIDNAVNYLRNNYKNKTLVLLLPKTNYANKPIIEAIRKSDLKFKIQPVNSISQLADFLYSYPERILLYSGAASLAASMELPATVLCNKLSNPNFQYPTNKYVFLVK